MELSKYSVLFFRQHCSDCYNNRLGNDLWSEFNLEKIQGFLQDVYGSEHLNYYGLTERLVSHKEVKTHDLELLHDKTQHDKYTKDQGFSFWGPIDFSLCFSIYLLSAVILMIVYFKFVAKRKPCLTKIILIASATRFNYLGKDRNKNVSNVTDFLS